MAVPSKVCDQGVMGQAADGQRSSDNWRRKLHHRQLLLHLRLGSETQAVTTKAGWSRMGMKALETSRMSERSRMQGNLGTFVAQPSWTRPHEVVDEGCTPKDMAGCWDSTALHQAKWNMKAVRLSCPLKWLRQPSQAVTAAMRLEAFEPSVGAGRNQT